MGYNDLLSDSYDLLFSTHHLVYHIFDSVLHYYNLPAWMF